MPEKVSQTLHSHLIAHPYLATGKGRFGVDRCGFSRQATFVDLTLKQGTAIESLAQATNLTLKQIQCSSAEISNQVQLNVGCV
jgi:hypothetical protein